MQWGNELPDAEEVKRSLDTFVKELRLAGYDVRAGEKGTFAYPTLADIAVFWNKDGDDHVGLYVDPIVGHVYVGRLFGPSSEDLHSTEEVEEKMLEYLDDLGKRSC